MKVNIVPCLWFDDQGEEAARYYTGIFKNSKITSISHYPQDHHGKPAGAVLTVEFELNGQRFTALNGGPYFRFNEAVSLQVECATQEEMDEYWEKLSAGGPVEAQQCGWVKDKYGLSWQLVPKDLAELFSDAYPEKARRAFQAMMPMKKLDIAALWRAHAGE